MTTVGEYYCALCQGQGSDHPTSGHNTDDRWLRALDGLFCIAFVARDDERQRAARECWGSARKDPLVPLPYEAEITGVEGYFVYVVLFDEDDPRRLFWCNVRPLAPGGEQ